MNGERTHVAEQFHRAVHERLKRGSWQTILFMEGPKRHVHERGVKKAVAEQVKKNTSPMVLLVEWVFTCS